MDPTYPGVHAGGDIITTTLDAVVKWGRRSSIWPMPFGTACCAIEFMALTASSHYDLARFGAEVLRFSPRQADLMFVAGTIVDKMAPVLKTIYDQMPEPKWVISMGVCASSGGFYRSYHVMQGIDEIIPVDVYVPGCPPSPEALVAAVMKIQDAHQERRAGQEAAGRAPPGRARRRAPSTAAARARPGRRTTPSAAAGPAARAAGAEPRVLRPKGTTTIMASATQSLRPACGPGGAGGRILRAELGRPGAWTVQELPGRPRRSRSRPTPGCSAASLAARPSGAGLQALPGPVRRRTSSTTTRRGLRDRFEVVATPTRSRASTTSASKTSAARDRRRAVAHAHRRLQGRQLVRARGLGPLRHRLRRATRTSTRILTHEALRGPSRCARTTRPRQRHVLKTPKTLAAEGARGLRAPAREHRPLAPGHARHLPRAGADGRRDDRGRRGRDRLHAPELREDGGDPDLLADHPVHRPAELLLVVHERATAGRWRSRSCWASTAPPRAEAIRVILSEFSRIMDHFVCIGTNVVDLRRDHAVLRDVPRARGDLRPARGLLRRAAHRLLRAHRRPGPGRAGGLRRRAAGTARRRACAR